MRFTSLYAFSSYIEQCLMHRMSRYVVDLYMCHIYKYGRSELKKETSRINRMKIVNLSW